MNDTTVRFCPYCGIGDDVHDPQGCEAVALEAEQKRIEQTGLCPDHDLGLPWFGCTCPEPPTA